MSMLGITMASTMGSSRNTSHVLAVSNRHHVFEPRRVKTDGSQHFHDGRVAFERPGPVRLPSLAVGSAVSGPSWSGLTSIWQTSPSPFKTGRREKGKHSDVSNSNDSSTGSRDADNGTFSSPRENASMSVNNTVRHTPMSDVTDPTHSDQFLMSRPSPTRQRHDGRLIDIMDSNSSILSNATLLKGSDPDEEPSDARSYSMPAPNEADFRSISVANINDFVPSRQQSQTRRRVQDVQFGATNVASVVNGGPPARRSNGLHADSRVFVPGQRAQSSTWQPQARVSHNYTPTIGSMGIAGKDHSGRDGRYAMFQSVRAGSRDSDQSFKSHFSNLQINGSPGLDHSGAFADGSIGPSSLPHLPASTGYPDIVENDAAVSTVYKPTFPAQSQFVAGYPVHATNGQAMTHNRTVVPSATASTVQTPSGTPPTASDSQQSNRGSCSSNRGSSHGDDGHFHGFDATRHIGHTRYTQQQASLSHGSYEYLPPATSSYASPYTNPLRMTETSGDYSGRHRSKETEKEQNMSAVLRDFRMHGKAKDYELKDVYNHIVEFSGDQHGSRFIQSRLETANSDEKEQVFAEIQDDAVQLMTDIFGNYVIQKLFEHGTQAQKRVLANSMRGRILFLTSQVYGCRVVQKALEHVLTDQQATMVKELESHVLAVVENQNGNHVIQKAIERVPGEYIQFIFDAHRGHIVRLSRHNYGCRVIQRMLEYGSPQAKRNILIELQSSIPALIEDQYGNYVMQHIIRHGEVQDRQRVVLTVQQQLLFFSKHKFASNVVETAIECAESQQRQEILIRLTTGADQYGQSQVYGLLRDQFGNYVIQKVINSLDGPARQTLVAEIEQYMPQLRKIGHGKQISALEKTVGDAKAKDAGWPTMSSSTRLYVDRPGHGPH